MVPFNIQSFKTKTLGSLHYLILLSRLIKVIPLYSQNTFTGQLPMPFNLTFFTQAFDIDNEHFQTDVMNSSFP